jgi:undecaprenyl-diphosphatase
MRVHLAVCGTHRAWCSHFSRTSAAEDRTFGFQATADASGTIEGEQMKTGSRLASGTAACLLMLCLAREGRAQAQAAGNPTAGVTPNAHQAAGENSAPERARFAADAFSDGAVLSLSLGLGLLSETILATGEILPQQPQPQTRLLSLDRSTLEATPIAGWGTFSTIGLGVTLAYAAVDPALSAYRNGVQASIVDAVIYAEAISISWAVTNLAKIAFRRPRPTAYQEQARLNPAGGTGVPVELSDTNSAMSFFSGHASVTASVAAAATYLAFSRSDEPLRPWLTLGIGSAMTSLVCYGRVKSGAHFPTDVIAGAMVGSGIGVLVAHTHRIDSLTRVPMWVGFRVEPGGGSLAVSGAL